jgi:hypothetical protein
VLAARRVHDRRESPGCERIPRAYEDLRGLDGVCGALKYLSIDY